MNMRSEVNSQEAKARNACRQKKDQEGFRVRFINDYIGSGVFCEKSFWKGDFLLEYRGELISGEEATHRDENYPDSKGSFLYFFQHGGKRKCIDGTASDGRGRMVNDSHKNANCKMKVVLFEGVPRLCLFAIEDLKKGDELRCDYGVKDLPWRKLEEETNSLPCHDPPSDSESCDTPCDVGNRHKRRKKSQNSTAMERAVHLPKVEVVIKLEPPEDMQDNFDCNYTIHEGIALPVVQTSSQGGGPSSTFGNMETLSSNVCTDQSGTGSIDAENITFIPETEDLQAFIQSHTDSSQEDEALKLCSISVPFIQLGDNLNSNLTESGQSYECIKRKKGKSSIETKSGSSTEREINVDIPGQGGLHDNAQDSGNSDDNHNDQDRLYITEHHTSKKSACFFCKKLQTKLSKHLLNCHPNEPEVAEISAKKKGSKLRAELLEVLTHKGNFYHNKLALASGSGEILVARRPPEKVSLKEYGPCPQCRGYYLKKKLRKHYIGPCVRSSEEPPTTTMDIIMQSDIVQDSFPPRKYLLPVIRQMKQDKITMVAKHDVLITQLGIQYMRRTGQMVTRKRRHFIAQRMRISARFLIKFRQLSGKPNCTMSEALRAPNYDGVVNAVLSAAGDKGIMNVENSDQMKRPSLACKLGYDLQKLALIKRATSLKEEDPQRWAEANDFLQMMASNWSGIKVSSPAQTTLVQRQFEKVEGGRLLQTSDKDKKQRMLSQPPQLSQKSLRRKPGGRFCVRQKLHSSITGELKKSNSLRPFATRTLRERKSNPGQNKMKIL